MAHKCFIRSDARGFPPQILDHFKLGFPDNWKELIQSVDVKRRMSSSASTQNSNAEVPNATKSDANVSVDLGYTNDVNAKGRRTHRSKSDARREESTQLGDQRAGHSAPAVALNGNNEEETNDEIDMDMQIEQSAPVLLNGQLISDMDRLQLLKELRARGKKVLLPSNVLRTIGLLTTISSKETKWQQSEACCQT